MDVESEKKVKLRFDILSIFPGFFDTVFTYGIPRRAQASSLIEISIHDLRRWTTDKHRMTDDRPFGGGDGMVMKPEPIFAAVEELSWRFIDASSTHSPDGTSLNDDSVSRHLVNPGSVNRVSRVVLLSPQGRVFNQAVAAELAAAKHIVLICGRYEGVDERIAQRLATDEISIGDYILSGGEAAAVVVVDAVTRLIEGALGNATSAVNESFSDGVLDFPHYTRPPVFRGEAVPDVLIGGNHAEVNRWRRKESLRKTFRNRPDLLERASLSDGDGRLLDEIKNEEASLDDV